MYGPGTVLASRYRLDERVGAGGMGQVWRATDQVLERTVAVKLMRQELVEEAGFAERFLTEARTMAAIRHPGVVAIHDYQGDINEAFLVMEYVEGESLARRLHRFGHLDPARTMGLIAQAAEALHAAHEKGVVHRDIKPGNLLVTPADTVVLTDFGIARSLASTGVTATGAVVGTPSYLSPEQVLGKPATPISDVYALGVVAYECLAGRRPYDGDHPFEVAMKRLREPPPPLGPAVPPAVRSVVERTLAPDPAHRWGSAAELAAAARHSVQPPAPGAPGAPATTPVASADGAPSPQDGSPRFAPARAAVPVAEPTPPPVPAPAPTRLERSPSPPPAPPASPPPYPGTRPPPNQPPAAPPPWAKPARPVVVWVASALLALSAGALALYFGGTLRVLDAYIGVYGNYFSGNSDVTETLEGATTLSRLAAASGLVTAVLIVLLSWGTLLGKRPARVWAQLLGALLLCCCGPAIATESLGNSVGSIALTPQEQSEIADRLAEALPDWYERLAGGFVLVAMGALLLALFLFNTPPAARYFRPRPVYYPPYPPYPYPYHHGYRPYG
jgi:serine/threonine protein kinase